MGALWTSELWRVRAILICTQIKNAFRRCRNSTVTTSAVHSRLQLHALCASFFFFFFLFVPFLPDIEKLFGCRVAGWVITPLAWCESFLYSDYSNVSHEATERPHYAALCRCLWGEQRSRGLGLNQDILRPTITTNIRPVCVQERGRMRPVLYCTLNPTRPFDFITRLPYISLRIHLKVLMFNVHVRFSQSKNLLQ